MDEGGESACWLDRVCPECGRLRERPGPGPCENCGADGGSVSDLPGTAEPPGTELPGTETVEPPGTETPEPPEAAAADARPGRHEL